MDVRVKKSEVTGSIAIPGSKSHTIRSLFISCLAEGISEIQNPLISDDTLAAVETCRAFGAMVECSPSLIKVRGVAGNPVVPENIVDVKNSGTTLRFAASVAGLVRDGWTVITGDHQVRRRPMHALLEALNSLGATAYSARNNGCAPVLVKGLMNGGTTRLDAVTSQYLSSLLICTPLVENDTRIIIERLNEVPYVEMTLKWLDNSGIKYVNNGFETFEVFGRQKYKAFRTTIPGDFSSATFFAVLSAISGHRIVMENLDMNDTQGDKRVFEILEDMGAKVTYGNGFVAVEGGLLKGIEADMNSIPDALPAMAVAGCFAEGETRLLNVLQARMKETDRISVMCSELRKMGADIEELEDGLVVRNSNLSGCSVDGHNDHRVVMALAIAGLNIKGTTIIRGAEAASVTFPTFFELLRTHGGNIEI
jgi:3-phosphoshikimate 1-carboxyvinyltransferase